jgi:hypothetical protein
MVGIFTIPDYEFAKLFQSCYIYLRGPVAQLAEQLTLNQWVQGSSPCRIIKKTLVNRGFFYWLGRDDNAKSYTH